MASAESVERSRVWTMRVRDQDGELITLSVYQLGNSVALRLPGQKPVWFNRYSGDLLASLVLKAVSAATYAVSTPGRHECQEFAAPRAERVPNWELTPTPVGELVQA